MPVKHFDMQAAINTHLLQSNGTGAFDGQHGISLAISPDMADGDISSAACIDIAAITGNDIGPNARPAITSAASIWRMTKTTFTTLSSHKLAAKGSALLTVQEAAVLIGSKLPASICPHGFVSAAVPIPADQDRATRNRRNPQILPLPCASQRAAEHLDEAQTLQQRTQLLRISLATKRDVSAAGRPPV